MFGDLQQACHWPSVPAVHGAPLTINKAGDITVVDDQWDQGAMFTVKITVPIGNFCACMPEQAEVEAANATWSYTAFGRTVHAFTLMENPMWNGSTSMVSHIPFSKWCIALPLQPHSEHGSCMPKAGESIFMLWQS